MRFVFKEWTVVLATTGRSTIEYDRLLKSQGFVRIEFTDETHVRESVEKHKPNLVVLGRELPPDLRLGLLREIRAGRETAATPVLFFGTEEERAAGTLYRDVQALAPAKWADLPMDVRNFTRLMVEFLDPFVDQDQERSYNIIAKADKLAAAEPERAAVQYAEGLNLYERNHQAWARFASVLAVLGRGDEAEIAYLKSLELNQYALKTYLALAMFYEKREDYDLAVGIMRQALGVAVIIQGPETMKSKIAFHIGRLDVGSRRMDQARESFDRAIESNPQDAQLRVDIGDAYAAHGHYAEAESHYQAALDIDPNMAHVFNRLGIAYRKQGKFDKAIDLFTNARQHRPEDENLMFNMARAHFEAGNMSDAEALLDEALSVWPDFKPAQKLLAKIRSGKRVIELVP